MQHRKKKWLSYSIGFSVLLLLTLGGYILTNRPYANGVLGFYVGLKEVRPKVFVSPDVGHQTIDSLLATIDSAIMRNEAFWGEAIDIPNIIYCHNQEMADRYTFGDVHAEALFTPFSRHVVVTETGLNTDMISHELAHVALFDRMPHFKWYMLTYRVPVWFDEGLAMQVDYRASYSTELYLKHTSNGAKAPPLATMARIPDFYAQDTLGWYRYATSKHEANRWLQQAGRQGLHALIQSCTVFSDFDTQYNLIESTTENH